MYIFALDNNIVERIVVLESEEIISASLLPEWMYFKHNEAEPPFNGSRFPLAASGISLDDIERDLIRQALDWTSHNKAQAAKMQEITCDALRYQVKKFRLE